MYSVSPMTHARTPRLATPRAVLFDLDGTLIDTMQTFADVARFLDRPVRWDR